MVAIFVTLTIVALVLVDIVVKKAEERGKAAVPARPIVMVPEVGLTLADGGEEVKKEEEGKGT